MKKREAFWRRLPLFNKYWFCYNCKHIFKNIEDYKYCPHCGLKMEGKNDNR